MKNLNDIPASTKWTLDAAGDIGRSSIDSVYMIICRKTGSKGSGFLLDNGFVITNEHVVNGESSNNIMLIDAYGKIFTISKVWRDDIRDLAILKPEYKLKGGFEISLIDDLKVGETVNTWGYPLGYNGPSPLLSVGYLAGFNEVKKIDKSIKHLVVNGAFNSGNSGGALFRASDNKIIGIVVSKHAPISEFHQHAIEVLAENKTGVTFSASNDKGETRSFAESQIVAELLTHMRSLTQVMIGEAISVNELIEMIDEIDLSKVDDHKMNRNDLCHCGSGLRFKHCHGKQ